MGGNTDQMKGRIKQSIAAVTGDEELKKEGQNDERVGQIKQKADETIDIVRHKLDDVAEALSSKDKEK